MTPSGFSGVSLNMFLAWAPFLPFCLPPPIFLEWEKSNHLEERLCDQAQARAPYTPPSPYFGVICSMPQGMISDV